MQISLKWVNELVNIETVNLDYLIEKLTLGGFEIENILETELNNQTIITLDISATANRSDSLSVKGISKEIAALLNKPSKIPKYSLETLNWKKNIEQLYSPFSDNYDVSVFIALIIENITNFTVPKWIQQKLISSGITVENNLSDFKNYILLETGYPFEFYDLDKIYSKVNKTNFKLTITPESNKKEFIANNNINYQLNDSILTVKADEWPISIAGIIPNNAFHYSKSTKSLLVEGSIFNSTKIRQQSRSLGLRTDRSARYEKSLKNVNMLESLYRLVYLLKVSNPELICKLHTINKNFEQNPKPIFLHYDTITEILGPIKQYKTNNFIYVTPKMVSNYLNRLNFDYSFSKTKLSWKVTIPYSRSEDITREIDLVEEIGRLHGFNNFLTRLPNIKRFGIEDASYQTRRKLTSCLLNLGFNELIHYSLVNEKTFIDNEIKLINPLLTDCSNLRISLLPSLIKTVQENLKQGNSTLEGFEYGHVFSGDILTNLQEKEYITGIFGGIKTKRNWTNSSELFSWFEGKGKIEQLFNQLNLLTYWELYKPSENNQLFHPHCTAKIYLSNKTPLGVFGKIHPILAKKLNLPLNLYLFEFDFKLIQQQIQRNKLTVYREYSVYPKIIKDLSFIIHQDISFEEVQRILHINGSKFLSQINLLDEYKGNSIPTKHSSLCLQLIFQSNEKTLQNKELEKIIHNLQSLLVTNFNVVIRV